MGESKKVLLWRLEHVVKLPIGVGSRESQAVFLRANEQFTLEYPRLHDLFTQIFIRGLPLPDEREVERLKDAARR